MIVVFQKEKQELLLEDSLLPFFGNVLFLDTTVGSQLDAKHYGKKRVSLLFSL
jgi:hypothetical protein